MQSFSEGGGDHKIRNFYIQLNKDYIHQPFTTQKSPRFESIRIDRYFRLVLISITDKPDRNASPNLIGRNVLVHHGTRPDDSTVTDCHRFCEYGIIHSAQYEFHPGNRHALSNSGHHNNEKAECIHP